MTAKVTTWSLFPFIKSQNESFGFHFSIKASHKVMIYMYDQIKKTFSSTIATTLLSTSCAYRDYLIHFEKKNDRVVISLKKKMCVCVCMYV